MMKGLEWCFGYVTHRWLWPLRFERSRHEDFMVVLEVIR